MRDIFSTAAELNIKKAIDEGMFKNLPGHGKPVVIEHMLFVPADQRLAFYILKNSGIEPLGVSIQKEIESLHQSLKSCHDEAQKKKLQKKLKEVQIRKDILMEMGKRGVGE